jgi:hypothetical protein
MKEETCESCEIKKVEVTEDIEAGPPYKLCKDCHEQLRYLALRPLEYFNLTAKHGHSFLLHDDFYDNDTGEAGQPKIDVENVDEFPFPNLNEVSNDIEKLIDFGIVQFITDEKTFSYIRKHDKKKVLDCLNQRLIKNEAIIYKLVEIAANGLGNYAENWVRDNWKKTKNKDVMIFAEALAKCLPFDEGFNEVTHQIELEENKDLPRKIMALVYFERTESLDWIEKVRSRIGNISDTWGTLAAASKMDWSRTKRWLNDGRPLSLIALDSLYYCTTTGNRLNQSLWLREHRPKLLNADRPEIIATTINDYLKKDSVPRVKNVVGAIIHNLFEVGD